MESLNFTDSIRQIYLDLIEDYTQIGLAIQSCLKRSASDLLHLLEKHAIVRLVKGAYHESEQHPFHFERELRANYLKLREVLFANSDSKFAIATHDAKLIRDAIRLAKTGGSLNNKRFGFQFLIGIRDELKLELVTNGYSVSQYIPYETLWLPYSLRRLRERKLNLLLLARSLIQR
jgi:proline dehydrogenase